MSESVLFFSLRLSLSLLSGRTSGVTHFSKPVLFRLKKNTSEAAIVMSAAAAPPRPALVTQVN